MAWDGNIHSAREGKGGDSPKDSAFGTKEYKNGTYGQKDYTVRERSDGTADVYIKSDSNKGHSHDHIDSNGNLIQSYHDYLLDNLSKKQLKVLSEMLHEELEKNVSFILKK